MNQRRNRAARTPRGPVIVDKRSAIAAKAAVAAATGMTSPTGTLAPARAHPHGAEVAARVWDQVENGLDTERLLPTREKRSRDLAKKLDKPFPGNGWRKFVAGCAHAMENGMARQARNAEVTLVETVARSLAGRRPRAAPRAH